MRKVHPLPDPRLAKILRGLDKVCRDLDELHMELVEVLREQGVTFDEIGECYDPPKSRQAVSKWLSTRRARVTRGPGRPGAAP